MIKTANTPDGFVVRMIDEPSVGHERAYRREHDGTFSYCIGHKGPWFKKPWHELPYKVQESFRENMDKF